MAIYRNFIPTTRTPTWNKTDPEQLNRFFQSFRPSRHLQPSAQALSLGQDAGFRRARSNLERIGLGDGDVTQKRRPAEVAEAEIAAQLQPPVQA